MKSKGDKYTKCTCSIAVLKMKKSQYSVSY